MRKKLPNRAAQRAARKRVEIAVAEIVDHAISGAFNTGIRFAAQENPNSHSGHFIAMFARALRQRTAGYDGY